MVSKRLQVGTCSLGNVIKVAGKHCARPSTYRSLAEVLEVSLFEEVTEGRVGHQSGQ